MQVIWIFERKDKLSLAFQFTDTNLSFLEESEDKFEHDWTWTINPLPLEIYPITSSPGIGLQHFP